MASPEDALHAEERALFEQERGLVEMEAQIHAQEEGLHQMEKAFVKRNQTLVNLVGYVADQEKSLVTRAEAIGPRAKKLVEDALAKAGGEFGAGGSLVGKGDERQALLERRREILAARMEIVEEREALYAERLEAMESGEQRFAGFEDKLLDREKVIAETLRKLITQAGELAADDDDDDDGSDDEDEEPAPPGVVDIARPPPDDSAKKSGAKKAAPVHSKTVESKRESMTVLGGQVTNAAGDADTVSANSRAEDAVTRRRRERGRPSTNQFKILLSAELGPTTKHSFFRYRADGPEELPGLFLATPNLLKEGREVRLRIKVEDVEIETTGVVSWRRKASDGQGPPGMGIEIAELESEELKAVRGWMDRVAPMVV